MHQPSQRCADHKDVMYEIPHAHHIRHDPTASACTAGQGPGIRWCIYINGHIPDMSCVDRMLLACKPSPDYVWAEDVRLMCVHECSVSAAPPLVRSVRQVRPLLYDHGAHACACSDCCTETGVVVLQGLQRAVQAEWTAC